MTRTRGWLIAIILGSLVFSFGLTFWKESSEYRARLMPSEMAAARRPAPNAGVRLGTAIDEWGKQQFPVPPEDKGIVTTMWASVGVGAGLLAMSCMLPALVWGVLSLVKGRRPFPFAAWAIIASLLAWLEWYDAQSALRL